MQCCPSYAASRLRRCECGLVLSMLPGNPPLAVDAHNSVPGNLVCL